MGEIENNGSGGSSLATKIDLLKWVIGTVGLALITQIVTCEHNSSELKLEQLETDSKLITAISAKFDTTARVQLSYMLFIQPFITSENLRPGVQNSIDSLRLQTIAQAPGLAADSSHIAKQLINKQLVLKSKQGFALIASNNDRGPAHAPQDMGKAIQQEDSVLKANNNLQLVQSPPIDATVIKTIQQSAILLTPQKSDAYTLQGTPLTLWCKRNYYVVFNGSLRVSVNRLDPAAQAVDVGYSNVRRPDSVEYIRNGHLIFGKTDTVNFENYRYLVNLSNVGAAGYNPFTKAAYITVASYRK